jgi:hypothetical protein
MISSSDPNAIAAAMENFVLLKWRETMAAMPGFCETIKEDIRNFPTMPGPDTGNLNESIDADELASGYMSHMIGVFIQPSPNPNNGVPASDYGVWWNEGHKNAFTHRVEPPRMFLEGGSEEAFETIIGTLSGIWSGP